jgi:hypothetical protein
VPVTPTLTFSLPPSGIREAHASLERLEREHGIELAPEERAGYMRAALLNASQRAAIEALAADFPACARTIAYAPIREWTVVVATSRHFIESLEANAIGAEEDDRAASVGRRQRGLDAIATVARAFGVSAR